MKFYIKASSSYGYLYIFKHGVGPGTLPKDVTVNRVKDLPNGYTAVWTDRFLTTEELLDYDIPYETEINKYLRQVGYCQKHGDVVPCDEVEACDKVVASELSNIKYVQSDSNFSPEQYDYSLPLPKHISFCGCGGRSWVSLTSGNLDTWDSCEAAVDDARQNYKPGTTIYIYKIDMNNRSVLENCEEVVIPYVDACEDIKASKIVASKISDMGLLAREALECTTKDELSAVISGLDSLGLRKLFLHYTEMLRDDSLSVAYIGGQLSDELMSYYVDDIKANTSKSRRVDAATQLPIKPEDTLYDLYQIATTWCDDSEVDQILISNGTSPDSDFIVDENTDVMQAYIDLIDYIKNNIDPDILNEREYALVYGDDIEGCDKVTSSTDAEDFSQSNLEIAEKYKSILDKYGYDGDWFVTTVEEEYDYLDLRDPDDLRGAIWNFVLGYICERDDYGGSAQEAEADEVTDKILSEVTACSDVTAPKYFANMVSASVDDGDYDDEFLVEGYYDNQYRGLAESAETSDVSALNEYINDYANRGYFIKVHNLTDGTITQFSPDNWFDDIAPDGGATLFMTW